MGSGARVMAVLTATLAFAATATALINPSFTPIDLANQSGIILVLEMKNVDDKGLAHATVTKVVKGKFEGKEISVNLNASELSKVAGSKMREFIERGQKQAILFLGDFQSRGDDAPPDRERIRCYLHMAGEFTDNNQNEWFVLNGVPDNMAAWNVSKLNSRMLSTWNGSTDMLIRCIEYVMAEPEPILLCNDGVTWAPEVALGSVSGKVYAVTAVDLTGKNANGRVDLFIAADSGDKVFRFTDGKMADITERLRLTSRSQAFAFGDFDGSGTLDLASYDGQGLTVYSQQADGTFVPKACDTGSALAGGVINLTTVDVGNKGKPALIAATKAYPVMLTISDDGKATVKALGTGEFPADLGHAGQCLAADFDRDGLVDLVQICAKAGLFYKGKAPGDFAPPAPTRAACGEGRNAAALGDFDADGLLDVMVVAEDRNRLWHSLGGGRFVNMLVGSGHLFYYPRAGAIAVESGDFNNDGLADILYVYGIEQMPHLFYNRGFRTFGHAYMSDLYELNRLPQAHEGQQAGCLADFTGDGALDMLLVLKKDGEVWLFPRGVDPVNGMVPSLAAAVVALPLGGTTAGPVNVCAWQGKRPLGAQVVRAGKPGAFFGTRKPGPLLLKWKTPDGKEHEKTVEVGRGPLRVTLEEGK